MIGLLYEGVPVLGVIHNPIINELCLGTTNRTTLNGHEVRMRACDTLAEATLLATDMERFRGPQDRSAFERLRAQARMFRTWGDCYGYLLLASGYADIMLDSRLSVWDMMPLIPIIRGAGGEISTWTGADPHNGGSCVAASKNLHPQVIDLLNS
jgi:myo-inositol-1(or 4)-monophosphatase